MNVAQPWVLGVAAMGALVTCVLHFLSVRRPPTLSLPTMRFLPDRPVRAVSRSARPSDLLLLLLRVAVLMLAGIALAGVTWQGARTTRGRVIVVDAGNAANQTALRERVAEAIRDRNSSANDAGSPATSAVQRTATRVVLLDSIAHFPGIAELRSFRPDTLSAVDASVPVSGALLAGIRAATTLAQDEADVDSIDLDIVSTFAASGDDAALRVVRGAWPGRIRLVDVAVGDSANDTTTVSPRVEITGTTPNTAVLSALGSVTRGTNSTRASAGTATSDLPGTPAASTNQTTSDISSVVTIEWPASGTPDGWTTVRRDTIGALVAAGHALVFPFERMARVPESPARHARPIAWWSDGAVAALETPAANGCTRQVGAMLPASSDVLLGNSARALLAVLMGPCGGRRVVATLDSSTRAILAGTGALAPSSAFRSKSAVRTPWGSVMLAAALLLLTLEWLIRDRDQLRAPAGGETRTPLRKVA